MRSDFSFKIIIIIIMSLQMVCAVVRSSIALLIVHTIVVVHSKL